MSQLIEDLLTYSRVARDDRPLNPVDLDGAWDSAVEQLRATIDEEGASVSRAELPVVPGDAVQLTQAFANLIANAVKYRSPQRPCRIDVSAERDEHGWVVSVADNGIGIPPGQREAVFAMFAQVDPSARSGHGIGLATCQRIVERHGGRIWAEATPGGGTTIRFTLPQRC